MLFVRVYCIYNPNFMHKKDQNNPNFVTQNQQNSPNFIQKKYKRLIFNV